MTTTLILIFLIAFVASTLGSFVGLGGGVFAVPLYLIIGLSLNDATLISIFTILVMATTASYKYYKMGYKINFKIIGLFGLGVVIGSFIGSNYIYHLFTNIKVFKVSFGILVLIMGLFVVFKEKIPKMNLGLQWMLFFGVISGLIAGSFGIAGGIFNTPILYAFTTLDFKIVVATANFIKVISSLSTIGFKVSHYVIPVWSALVAMTGGYIGATIGTKMNKKIDEKYVRLTFVVLLCLVVIDQILF